MWKSYIIIDGNYVRAESKKQFGKLSFDYSDFVHNLVDYVKKQLNLDNLTLIRAYYYDSPPFSDPKVLKPHEKEFAKNRQRFLDKLRYLSKFEVVLGRIQYKGRNEKGHLIVTQKGVDVKMAIDLIDFAYRADYVILVTGDNDLVPAIKMAKQKTNANIILFYFENKKSRLLNELISEADFSFIINRELFQVRK